ncbi:MAG: MBL fold metallo-hydrolase [Burkholderiaceae bacterium]
MQNMIHRFARGFLIPLSLALPIAAIAAPAISTPATTGRPAQASAASTAGAAGALMFEPATVRMTVQKLTGRVYFVQGQSGMISTANQGFNSNAGFVITDDGVVVFDALGTPSLGEALLQRIREVTDKPVVRLVVSHYHSDHFYGAQAFKAAGADIWAQQEVLEYLKTEAPVARLAERRQSLFPWVDERARILAPDHTVGKSESFVLGGMTFQLFHVGPAHTPEDMMMYVESEKVLFAGDLVFAGRIPYVGDADSRAWLAALDDLSARRPEWLVPGHGEASAKATDDLDLTRNYLRFLREVMGRAVDELRSFDEAYEQTDWSAWASLPAFDDANRRNAYNTFILMEREALDGKR